MEEKLHNEEINDLYSSPNMFSADQIEKKEVGGATSTYGERGGGYRFLVGKSEAKRPLGRPRRGWEDNIKMDLQEVGCEGMDMNVLAQDRDCWRALVKAVMNLHVPHKMRGNSSLAENRLASQEGLRSRD